MTRRLSKKQIFIIGLILLALAATVLISIFAGKRIVAFVSDSSAVRAFVEKNGVLSRLIFVLITLVQIILAIIPGEPVELAAGYAFGTLEGTALCLFGAAIGGMIDFFLVRLFGVKIVRIFFSHEKIEKLKFLKASKKRDFWMFMLMFIPGTPKDILSYVAGLTDIKWYKWLVLSCLARIPSIVTSTMSADALGTQKYLRAGIAYGVTLVISILGMIIYNKVCDAHKENEQKNQNIAPEKEIVDKAENEN